MAHKAANELAGMNGQNGTLHVHNNPQPCALCFRGCVQRPLSLRLLMLRLGGDLSNSLFIWSGGGAWLA